jgi:hypothetical protein
MMSEDSSLKSEFVGLARGYWVTQMIFAAAELGIADHLVDGSKSVQELAGLCDADADSLFRLLRGLASVGIFREIPHKEFVLTPLAELLRSDHPDSLRQFARLQGEERYFTWGKLLQCIKSGHSVFHEIYGKPVFAWNRENPHRASIFDDAMTDMSRIEVRELLKVFDFQEYRHLVDLGGGNGYLLSEVMEKYPYLQGTLFDLGQVADQVIPPVCLKERWSLQSGDFFCSVPAGADCYLLKNILHDWGDSGCAKLLGNIRKAMDLSCGHLIIYEQIIPDGNKPFIGKLLDINMLLMHEGGMERTRGEFERLLANSGFTIKSVISTECSMSVIVAGV